MERKLDLHVHSRRSFDGRMELDEIVELCRAAGLDGCAVCDHDAVLPQSELRRIREKYPDFLLIPGTEVSTDRGHLLGWFVTEPVTVRTFEAAAAAIHAQGGIAVLAHPYERSRDAEFPVPCVPYIDGVEVWNSRAERKNPRANAMAEAFAQKYGLRRFAGSDAHVPREIGNAVTALDVPDGPDGLSMGNAGPDAPSEGNAGPETEGRPLMDMETLKAALLDSPARTSGRRARALDTARSQFTRRKKRRAGVLSYCKWALFAVKCLLQDLFAVLRRP